MKARSLKPTPFALVLGLAFEVARPPVGAVMVLLLGSMLGAVLGQAQDIRAATALAQVVDGYVVGVTLTDGGGGYGVPPAVSFTGGGGSGAVAETKVRNGVVDKIVLINAGSGYGSQAAVNIVPPEMPILQSVGRIIALTIQGRVGATHQILSTDELVPATWRLLTDMVVTSSPYRFVDEAGPLHQRYYRVAAQSEAPVLESARLVSRLIIQGAVGTTNWIMGTDWAVPRVWHGLTSVVVTSSPYVWVDEAAGLPARQYRVSATPEVPVEKMDPRHWAWIPPGMFTMGSSASERGRDPAEGPQTQVILTKGFWMGRHEVTQEDYQAVIGSNPSTFQGDLKRPVEMVSWYDATNYCDKLTERERAGARLPAGYQYRLPTEAEWEYACRAGTTTRYSFGDALECDDQGDSCALLDSYMWWFGNTDGKTRAVGGKKANPWGLYDMYGNVWEWCSDQWSESLSGGSVIDPTGPDSGPSRVIRGGYWFNSATICRSAFRTDAPPGTRSGGDGFRVVLAPGQL